MDEPVDTDRLAVPVQDDHADPESGATADDYGYLLDAPADDQFGATPHDGTAPDDSWDEAAWTGWQPAPHLDPDASGELFGDQYPDQYADEYAAPDEDRFDAFNANTWHFKAAPPPWYRTRQAVIALAAVVAAIVALVISVVLLAFRGPSDTDVTPATDTSSTPTTPASTPDTTSALPPPPPPPPVTSESPAAPPPVYNRPRYEPRPSKPPEIGVTRTPVTRTQISVAPQPRSGSQRR
ncbi:hypothetical protein CIW52_05385 [Mycolicibacterium sp. P9-64]|nr:hypothetical protein CIW52_05385 [Mycolicibacterium sp. P9-64]